MKANIIIAVFSLFFSCEKTTVESDMSFVIEELIDDLESSIDKDDLRIQTDSWLVMAEPSVFLNLS